MAITISTPTQSDRDSWSMLYHQYADFYQVPMNENILDSVWSWIFDNDNPFYALVAKTENNRLIGFMHYRAMPSPLRGKMVGFLDDLYVNPEYRGQGVVDELFAALEQSARDLGWPFVRWITAENNYRARAVYDRIADKTAWQTYQMNIT